MFFKTSSYKTLAAALALTAGTALSQDITTVMDFEAGTNSNLTGGFWYYVDDAGNGGNSVITSGDTTAKPPLWNEASVGPGNAGSKNAAKFSFTFGDKMLTCGAGCTPYAPEVLIGTDIRNTGDSVVDLTGATKMTFWAKAEPNNLSVSLIYVSADITDYSYFRKTTVIKKEWAEYTILMSPSTNLSSPGWGQAAAKAGPDWSQAKAFNFSISKSLNTASPSATLYIDDVKIHGWVPKLGPIAVRAPATQASRMLTRLVSGGAVRLAVPEAYRKASGKVAVVDLSGKVLVESRFASGQAAVDMDVPRSTRTAFVRVLAD